METTMTLKPRMSEKAYAASKALNTYVFMVPLTASKADIMDAVSKQFDVTVVDARMSIVKGKTKQSYRKGRRPVTGKRADMKKAYVRIKDGDKIGIFGEEEKAEQAAAKAAEKASKSKTKKAEKK